jgi:hypothetical protein
MPSASSSFEGLSNGGDPPNTNGDVGPQHYIQAINTSFAIYSKVGALMVGPISLNAFFAAAPATGTPCDTGSSTYPIVLYDPLADRWVLTVNAAQRAGLIDQAPFYECIAVSRTPDPINGGWYKYALQTGADLTPDLVNDAPKLAVWPDAYYMSANMYTASGTFDHTRVWALDRVALLAGKPLREVHFDVPGYKNLLPSNLRGARPPAGSPNYFMSADPASSVLHLWRFHADFDTRANSWFGANSSTPQPTSISVASYTIPTFSAGQPGTQIKLDALAGQLMPPVQYRNINGTQSLWANHTIKSQTPGSNQLATRWYEIRDINTAPAVYQQGTFDNGGDGVQRWMGALAVDRFGNMAIGYSVSKGDLMGVPGIYPGIRYTGRLVADAIGLLPQGEITLTAGTGIHTYCESLNCTVATWGKYSAMTVDPTDDCTFWYTNEYGVSGNASGYQTSIGSFRYPVCANANLIVDRSDDSDTRGCSTTTDDCSLRGAINILNSGGFAGATITFDPSVTRIDLTGSLPIVTASHNAIQGMGGAPRIDGALAPGNTMAIGIDATEFSLSGLSVVNLDPIASSDIGVLGGTRVSIFDNYLGTLPSGASTCTPAGAVTRNAQTGILVNSDVTSDAGAGHGSVYIYNNTIACHAYGIYLSGADGVYAGQTPSGTASPNRIGLNASNIALPNYAAGIAIAASNSGDGASSNTINHNIIANNGADGIWMNGNDSNDLSSTSSNTISGNRIYNNGGDGIRMELGAFFNIIGGVTEAERNLIYGNSGHGIHLINSAGNGILGNSIGSVAGGGPNAGHGILLDGSDDNWVGASTSGTLKSRNVIGGNSGDGVQITHGAHANTVIGNDIGTSTLGNGLNGVAIYGGAHDNSIDEDNHLSHNTFYGLILDGSGTQNNVIRKVIIDHNGLDGIGERNGATNNRWSMLSTHHNGGMGIDKEASSDGTNVSTAPYPVITSVFRAGSMVTVNGKAQPGSALAGNSVEVYAVSVNAGGFAEGFLYLGTTDSDSNGDWSLGISSPPSLCYVALETPYSASLPGYAYSTEFSPTNCRWFAPLMRRGL